MKNDKITRDTVKQNEFKKALKKESISFYGVEKCYASHKQYKGLIASHIKPYKLCVLDGDVDAEFDINNGLLLAKSVDDYFDKLLITFNNDGEIICSDDVADDIRNEFKNYKLDEEVFNDKRKYYMCIHRSLYFYKNYIHASSENGAFQIEQIDIPYLDNGIKIYNGSIIVNENNTWTICPLNKVKNTFIERSKGAFKPKYYVTNADFLNKFLQQSEYTVDFIPSGFNCLSSSIDLTNLSYIDNDNLFKLNRANFNLSNESPKCFIELLKTMFNNDGASIEEFRRIIKVSLIGNGYEKNIVFNGNKDSVQKILYILSEVFGSYVYVIRSIKDLKRGYTTDCIPNCCMLFLKFNSSTLNLIDANVIDNLLKNSYYSRSVLNVSKYTPFYFISGTRGFIDNSICFTLFGETSVIDTDSLIEQEGDKILNWFITANLTRCTEQSNNYQYDLTSLTWIKKSVIDWINLNCVICPEKGEKTSVSVLYNNYKEYYMSITDNNASISLKMFSKILGEFVSKKRCGKGIFYIGIQLKDSIDTN